MAHDLLERDDPGLARNRLGQERDLHLGAFTLGLVSGHWPAWQAAHVEVHQEKDDIAGQVVARLFEETGSERTMKAAG